MTIHSSGSEISLSQINADFALGTSLSSYRGVTWYKNDFTTGTFPYSELGMSQFYDKRNTSPGPSVNVTYVGAASVYKVGSDTVIEWTSSGTMTFSGSLYCQAVTLGGGGGGGGASNDRSGGGGAGGIDFNTYNFYGGWNISIGAGGPGAPKPSRGVPEASGTGGSNTSVINQVNGTGLVAYGGGGGSRGYGNYGFSATGGSSGNGFAGGADGGGGGGAGGRAVDAAGYNASPGGPGYTANITGSNVVYGGGGGGGAGAGAGGSGGGGDAAGYNGTGLPGANGLGGGGGGSGGYGGGGAGGSGRFIIRGYFNAIAG